MFVHALNRFHPRCAHNLTTSTIIPILPFPPSWVKHPSWALHVWVSWTNTHYSHCLHHFFKVPASCLILTQRPLSFCLCAYVHLVSLLCHRYLFLAPQPVTPPLPSFPFVLPQFD